MALQHGASVVVMIDCADERLCEPIADSLIDGERVEGALSEVAADSLLVRSEVPKAALVPLHRDMVDQLFLVKPSSHQEGVLIGSAIGLAFCTAAGLYGEEDLLPAAKLLYTSVFVGGGGALGYLADSDPPTLALIYEQQALSARVRR
ncbi:MAG: hypothetical protein PVJ49_10625 [Acidobacteriota bacterium]|jgi:hypothetical protein